MIVFNSNISTFIAYYMLDILLLFKKFPTTYDVSLKPYIYRTEKSRMKVNPLK